MALKQSLGVSASTCSYKDWIGTDLLVFFGSNTPNNQPVTTKYIYQAKKLGTRVVVINPYREPGLERYWIPSVAESALFGTKIADAFFQVNTGGDRAFIAGVIKHMIDRGLTDESFLEEHTTGFEDLKLALEAYSWEMLEEASGASRDEMLRFAGLMGESRSAVFVWSMGITQHRDGVANVRAIADLALTRGFVGREKCGLMAIRGHSGVQGGAEVGAVPNQFPGGLPVDESGAEKMSALWGFDVPSSKGLNAVEMIEAAHDGKIDLLFQVGGNFLETLPDPQFVRESSRARALQNTSRHSPQPADVRRTLGSSHSASGANSLRASGGRDRDYHGAAYHLQPGDSWSEDWRIARGVANPDDDCRARSP